jgi:hypothetical protein
MRDTPVVEGDGWRTSFARFLLTSATWGYSVGFEGSVQCEMSILRIVEKFVLQTQFAKRSFIAIVMPYQPTPEDRRPYRFMLHAKVLFLTNDPRQ